MKNKYPEKNQTENSEGGKKKRICLLDVRPSAKTINFIKDFAHSYYVESSLPEKCRDFVLN